MARFVSIEKTTTAFQPITKPKLPISPNLPDLCVSKSPPASLVVPDWQSRRWLMHPPGWSGKAECPMFRERHAAGLYFIIGHSLLDILRFKLPVPRLRQRPVRHRLRICVRPAIAQKSPASKKPGSLLDYKVVPQQMAAATVITDRESTLIHPAIGAARQRP